MQNEAKLLTITQAATFLKVSPDSLRRWEEKGIVTPQRTKGGSRRYTLLDLKIAKLNKRKIRFFQISTLLKQNYLNYKRDLRVAFLTSFLWLIGLLIYHFLTPIFLAPTNPEQQVLSNQLKTDDRLRIASEATPIKAKVLLSVDQNPVTDSQRKASLSFDLLIGRPTDTQILQYTNTSDQYYSLQPLPKIQIPTLIRRI